MKIVSNLSKMTILFKIQIFKGMSLYNSKFFKKREKLREWQNLIGVCWAKFLNIQSITDFGCGNGYLLEGLKSQGAKVIGYEAFLEEAWNFIPEDLRPFIKKDSVINRILTPQTQYSMSIEVAEHIESQFSQCLVENLCSCASERILFTAAPPGQEGTGHINCQLKDYWISLFACYDFEYNSILVNSILEQMRKEKIKERWIGKNLLIFERKKND